MNQPRHILAAATLALGLAGWSIPAAAQTDDAMPATRNGRRVPPSILEAEIELETVRIDRRTAELVHQLVADAFTQREEATRALKEHTVTKAALYKILIDEPLTPEQRYRLLRVLEHKILRSPRGALGIEMQPDARGVLVTRIIEDMPAELVLRAGDCITAINGQPVQHQGDLIVLVQSKPPGTPIRMDILRQEPGAAEAQTIEVTVRLGSIEGLRDPETGAISTNNAWSRRLSEFWRFAEREYAPRTRVMRVATDRASHE